MASEKKVATNRINGGRSRGPRTPAGKSQASRNALRHGLAAMTYRAVEPGEIEQLAKAICGGDTNPALFEQALIIAEHEIVLRCVRTECVAVIERLRDGTAIALANGDNSIALGTARNEKTELAWAELQRIFARFGVASWDELSNDQMDELANEPPLPGWRPMLPAERDEAAALRAAMPDLERLARYERRAWSRRKRAIRKFMDIKSME